MKLTFCKLFLLAMTCLPAAVSNAQSHTPSGPTAGPVVGPPEARQASGVLPPKVQARLERAEAFEGQAILALDKGDYAVAEEKARKSMETFFGAGGLSNEILALALYRDGKKDEAFEEFGKLDQSPSGDPRNKLPYALMLLQRGDWKRAVKAYNDSKLIPGNSRFLRDNSHFTENDEEPEALMAAIHIAMGLICETPSWGQRPQEDLAVAEYKIALDLEPDSALANYYYGYGLRHLIGICDILKARRENGEDSITTFYIGALTKSMDRLGGPEVMKQMAQQSLEMASRLGTPDVSAGAQKALDFKKLVN